MCGIAGFVERTCSRNGRELESLVMPMAEALQHRGPDDQGVWSDGSDGVVLAHRRLSIIDLSPAGHQPMTSFCGRYVMVFNGEVYNFRELRQDLEAQAFVFSGHSDTEVMLAAISHYGLKKALGLFNGMFAFALWDKRDKVLFLCRDRLGEKPLYYGFVGQAFVFGSELKALVRFPGFKRDIDREALTSFLRYNCIPAPLSIYKAIRKLLPGQFLTFQSLSQEVRTEVYWSALDVAAASRHSVGDKSPAEMQDDLEILLRDAVKIRMESDVPLGVFLSGGIDSSLITALMQAQSRVPVKTFTIAMGDPRYNEADEARQVAAYLGTEHMSFQAQPDDALKVIADLPRIYDEPFADSSQIPTIMVSRMAREHVTVCLSGDGGDEVFGGYNRYAWLERIWKKIGRVSYGVRRPAAGLLALCPPDMVDHVFECAKGILPSRLRLRNPGIKYQKFVECLAASTAQEAYLGLTSHWKEPQKIALHGGACFENPFPSSLAGDIKRQMMYCDTVNYLPNDILVKVDRASMSVSLESRAVYLDHRLVAYAAKLPMNMLVGAQGSKLVLRNILRKYLPASYWERPKMGFAIPVDAWLRGSLKDWAAELLSEDRLKRQGFFDAKMVRQKWQEHQKETRNWQFELWDILMFNAWLEHNGKTQ